MSESIQGPNGQEMHNLVDGTTSSLWITNDGLAYRRYTNSLTNTHEWAKHPTLPNCDEKGRMYLCVGTTRVLLDNAISKVWQTTYRGIENKENKSFEIKEINTEISPRIQRAIECLQTCEPIEDFASRCFIKKGTAWSYVYDAAQHETLDVLGQYIFSNINSSLLLYLDTLAQEDPSLLGGPLTPLVCHCDKFLDLSNDKYGEIRLARHFLIKTCESNNSRIVKLQPSE